MQKKVRKTKSTRIAGPGSQSQPGDLEAEFDERKLQIKIEQIEENIFPKRSLSFAFKNPLSYLILCRSGMKLIEDSTEIYSVSFPVVPLLFPMPEDSFRGLRNVKDVIYVEHLGYYLCFCDCQYFRKDIDGNPPYPYTGEMPLGESGEKFRYSRLNQRLLLVRNGQIHVFNFGSKRVELEILRNEGLRYSLVDYKLVGRKENKLVYLTFEGSIYIFCLNFEMRKICSKQRYQVQIDFHQRKHENGVALEVCDQGKFFLVNIRSAVRNCTSRMIVFELRGHKLIQAADLDIRDEGHSIGLAMSFWKRIGKHLIWITLSRRLGNALIFDFNGESGGLRELDGKRVRHKEFSPSKMCHFGDQFYFTGREGRISRLTLTH